MEVVLVLFIAVIIGIVCWWIHEKNTQNKLDMHMYRIIESLGEKKEEIFKKGVQCRNNKNEFLAFLKEIGVEIDYEDAGNLWAYIYIHEVWCKEH